MKSGQLIKPDLEGKKIYCDLHLNFTFLIFFLKFYYRDLGEHLRGQLKSILGQPNIVRVNETKLDKQLVALEQIANDVHNKKYTRKYNSTASGLTPDQCKRILSSEFLDEVEREDEPGLFKKLFKKKQNDPKKE